ncbi:MAG: undecaprenyl-phosphate galactose phosphotransferase WbaP [Phycisphaeraceae bacterium]|nr:undecaprenyl-phosphate galactose phosphotransferase WbaP [Phycisphaeraceae bacterium]
MVEEADAPGGAEDVASRGRVLAGVRVQSRPWLTVLIQLTADLISLAAALVIAVGLRWLMDDSLQWHRYVEVSPVLLMFVVVFAWAGMYSGLSLYPGVALGPADELRRSTASITAVYLILITISFLLLRAERGAMQRWEYSRGVVLMAWMMSLLLVPVGRSVVRNLFARRSWWGHPVAILGAGRTAELVIEALRRRPAIGLKPVVALDDDPSKKGAFHGVPVIGGLDLAPRLARRLGITYAIVAMPGATAERMRELGRKYGDVFPHLLLIPNIVGFSSLWVVARDLGGVCGLEVRQRLLLSWPRTLKRAMDLCLTVVGGLVILPLLLLIALAVKLDSRGPVLFGHERIGREGRPFNAWKFRSMRHDADKRLADYLEAHPELRQQWERDHKLRDDPRVTRLGWLLRKTSLDELPQLWNVLVGQMSLVGPRPIVTEEIDRYREDYALYLKVRPGITGLWQISGRNDTSYHERVNLDAFYVRNWSVWLDLYVLSRTAWVVLFGRGAY